MDVFGSAVRDDFRPGESDAIKNRYIIAEVERTTQALYGS